MLSLLLGYCPSLIREIEGSSPHGTSLIEVHGSRTSLLKRLAEHGLPPAGVLFFDAGSISPVAAQRLITSVRSIASHIIIAGVVENRPAGWSPPATVQPDLFLRFPDDLPRLRELLAEHDSAADAVGESRDLERKLAMAQLRMQTVLDQLAEGVAIIDAFGIVTRVNRRLVDLLGAEDASAFLGKPCHEVLWGLRSQCRTCPRMHQSDDVQEMRTHELSGRTMHLDVSARHLADASGVAIGTIETIRDAAPRLRLEESIVESEKMKAIGLIAAGLAHELRNPLAIISTTAECCMDMQDDPEVTSSLESITNAVRAAEKVIRDLLNFARPAPDYFESVSIRELLASLAGMLSAECRKRGVKIAADLDRELPSVYADRAKLQQALLNFMLNGIEAMESGGTLTISARRSGGRTLEVAIADTGRGMTEPELARVFEPFYSSKPGGVGMGMPISMKIVQAHQGHVRIDSSPGRGTTVRIALPAVEAVEHKAVGIA